MLILNPNTDIFGRQSIPSALISSLLKKNNHHVELFDTTFMDLKNIMPELLDDDTKIKTELNYFENADYSMKDYEIIKFDSLSETLKKRCRAYSQIAFSITK